jgi:hypothetical protein
MRPLWCIALLSAVIACGKKQATSTPDASTDPLAACQTGLCGNGPLVQMTTMAIVGSDGMGHSEGFHLAGADVRGGCPPSGFTDVSTHSVVDNQMANVLPVLEQQIGSALPTLIQNSINAGGLALVFEIVGDPTVDPTVTLVVHHGKGSPLLGADGLLLADQTVEIDAAPPLGICTGATFANGELSCGPFQLLVTIVVFGKTYDLSFLGTMITMKFPAAPTAISSTDAGDQDGGEADAGTPDTDIQVLMGGAVTIDNIQAIATEAGPEAGNLGPIVQEVIPGLADVEDPTTRKCERISGTLSATARPVFATTQ